MVVSSSSVSHTRCNRSAPAPVFAHGKGRPQIRSTHDAGASMKPATLSLVASLLGKQGACAQIPTQDINTSQH